MKTSGLVLSGVTLLALSGCQSTGADGYSLGDPDDCAGVVVVANYGMLSEDVVAECVEFEANEASAKEVLGVAGLELEGTAEYGDQIVCRVNGLPSDREEFRVPGEEPHLETCADMPPAFAYWALWVREDSNAPWTYATEGVGTLIVKPGMSIGLAFSTGGGTLTPSDP